ncbi:HNH endonuclease signature motif containing protein [Arthrobacter sp. MDT2-2]
MTTHAYFNSAQRGDSPAHVLRLAGTKATATTISAKEQASTHRHGQKRAVVLSYPVPRSLATSVSAGRSKYNDEHGKARAIGQDASLRKGEQAGTPRTCSVLECEITVKIAELCPKHRKRRDALGTTALTTTRMLPPDEKFARRIVPDEYGCWMWTATKTYDKYPKLYVGGGRKEVRAHRWAYDRFVGPIPDGYEIDHICSVTLCVRPSHLQALPAEEHWRVTEARKELKELTGDERSLVACGRVTVAEREFAEAHGLSPLALHRPATAMHAAAR